MLCNKIVYVLQIKTLKLHLIQLINDGKKSISDENERCSSVDSSDLYQNDRTRSLSADSNRNDYERIDKFQTYYDDNRRKPSRQNSYLEAVKTAAGGTYNLDKRNKFFLNNSG